MEFATGDASGTHVLHYGGKEIELLPGQAQGVAEAIKATQNGTTRIVQIGFTEAATGETVQHLFPIGPGIAVRLVGPPLTVGNLENT